MGKPRIGILGASGFVGSALVERLFFDERYKSKFDFVAFIHSYGGAARLTRLPIQIEVIDLLSHEQLESSLRTCDWIVNCTRGDSSVMLGGFKNVLRVLKKLRPKKFVHLGSVAIYGDDPPAESAREDAPPNPDRTAYGDIKVAQDEMVFKLHRAGVPSLVLCPSNIGGPYSTLIVDVVSRLAAREILLVEEGRNPTNIVHVDNLVQAILAALESEDGWGEMYFVNETEPVTWKQFFEDMARIMGIECEFALVSREDVLQALREKNGRALGLKGQLKMLFSREFRDAMATVPAFNKMDQAAMRLFNSMNPQLQEKLRSKIRKPISIKESRRAPSLDDKLVRTQIRRVYHSPEKIMNRLNYSPLMDYREGMLTTQKWLEFSHLIPSARSPFF